MEKGAEVVATELDGVSAAADHEDGDTPRQHDGYSDRQIRRYAAVKDYLSGGGTIISLCRKAFTERDIQYRDAL